jgi:hypothetical protein
MWRPRPSAPRTASSRESWDEDPMNACQIWTQCPILHALQVQVHPIGFGNVGDGLRVSGVPGAGFRVWARARVSSRRFLDEGTFHVAWGRSLGSDVLLL